MYPTWFGCCCCLLLITWYVGITITFQLSLWSLEGRTLIVSNYNTKLRLIWCGEEEGGLCFYVNNSPAQNLFAVVNVVSFSSVFPSWLTTLIVVNMLCLTQRSYEKDLLIYFTFIISFPYTESFNSCFWATRSQIFFLKLDLVIIIEGHWHQRERGKWLCINMYDLVLLEWLPRNYIILINQ